MENSSFRPLVLNIYKPVGPTSFDIIRNLKRNLPKGFGKIGHFGTLDPFAEGVLLVGISGAMKLNDYVHSDLSKTYIATGKLGVSTNSGDLTGEVSFEDEKLNSLSGQYDLESLNRILKEKFEGEYWQTPHRVSATKHQGKPLYEWSREGVHIEKQKVKRNIYSCEVLSFNFPYVEIKATVSTGTYIRSLFEDFSKELGTVGHLTKLARSAIGTIESKAGLKEEVWTNKIAYEDLYQIGTLLEEVLPFIKIKLAGEQARKYRNGNPVDTVEQFHANQKVWVFDDSGLIGLGQFTAGTIKPCFKTS